MDDIHILVVHTLQFYGYDFGGICFCALFSNIGFRFWSFSAPICIMGVNGGGGEGGEDRGTCPPIFKGGGNIISNALSPPPPPPTRFWGCMIIHWNYDVFACEISGAFCFAGDVRWVPLLCVSESPVPLPPVWSGSDWRPWSALKDLHLGLHWGLQFV